ncbi:GTPase Era [Corynebacterium genitalium ATCC 33030]|uniref:GTPase Era n=1 Tax=Corynebacterium genitalium ATCC 33030 TaxID=585529 RepID=D7WE13_9CORY|nr:GTPase Era [Corynebacterium genitalium]EFK53488.1 ribosome biogenesis GTPase Era [Corynebacterium genitalium ATCC 33030]UUA88920.1 GTPase Era [Corynebacterium genitalium ATCC 33030]
MTSQPTDNQHDPADFFDQAIAGPETGPAAEAEVDALPNEFTDTPEGFRSGFVSFVGRPNTGKSTLTNALVGEKIAIMADQPETTRHPIRGIVNRPDAQIVLVDTPGLHRPRTLLGERLNDVVKDTFADVDVVGLTVPANEKIGPGDRWILDAVKETKPNTPIVGIVTKLDAAGKDQVGEQLLKLHDLLTEVTGRDDVDVVPVSATEQIQLDVLMDVLTKHLPEGPRFYPEGHVTDEDTETRIAELIREEALKGLRDELPHSVAVQIDEMYEDPDDGNTPKRAMIYAVMYLERPGQKTIIEGRDGRRLSGIIQRSRKQIIDLLGRNVYLDLRIKVLKNWQSDPKHLGRLGF